MKIMIITHLEQHTGNCHGSVIVSCTQKWEYEPTTENIAKKISSSLEKNANKLKLNVNDEYDQDSNIRHKNLIEAETPTL